MACPPAWRLRPTLLALASVALLAVALPTFAGAGGSDWTTYGYDPANTRNQPNEHSISTANAAQLAVKWVATTTGDVSGTPVVAGGAVYFGDFGGTVWKLNANTGAVIWSHLVSQYTGIAGDFARTSPSLDGNVLVMGTNKTPLLLGIDATTGALLWKTQVNPDLHGTQTGSPILAGDTVITGVSASGANVPGATFRGDIAAVNALTGQLLWESFSLPDNHGVGGLYAGATMFSAPAVDAADGLVFGTFGNLYSEPASVAACNAAAPNGFFSESCEQPGAFWKSIVAFRLDTGAPVWSYRVFGDPPTNAACGPMPVPWCAPASDGEKWDVGGSSANVLTLGSRTVVGFGGKSGVYYLFDAKTGALIWNTVVGPGGDQGGFEWGTAYDGQRIYGSLTNQHHIPYRLTSNGALTNTTVTGGSWMALDPTTGKIIWQTADPQAEVLPAPTGTVGVWDLGPVSVANGVVYTASMAKAGNQMYALDASSGSILWQFAAGSSVNAAPAVSNGSVYWGSGYSRAAEGSGNNKLYAFSINGIVDTTAPTTTIALSPSSPNGTNGWYRSAVGATVGATDNAGGIGVLQTRCTLDPATPPANFVDLPIAVCSLTSVATDGTHTIYAASDDKDNNVENPVVSRTFKIDATAPTISAAATTPPNANGFYNGDVVVHFTCADGGSGIPTGACPADQTLAGVGLAISSTAQTVTDAAGNASAPSNVVTVKISNAAGDCALTAQYVQRSSTYATLKLAPRIIANTWLAVGCTLLHQIASRANPIQRQVLLRIYGQTLQGFREQDLLTAAQASTLNALAAGL